MSNQSLFALVLNKIGGPPPSSFGRVYDLPKIQRIGMRIYNKTMTSDFRQVEQNVDAKARAKWGVPPMHWLITRYEGERWVNQQTYSVFYEYVLSAARKNQLSPEFLHTVIMGEGMMKYCDDGQKNDIPATDRALNVIDSYGKAGLDNLGKESEGLRGYLDEEYFQHIKPYPKPGLNEIKQLVLPAFIYGIDSVVFIVSAYLQKCRDAAKIYLKSINEIAASENEDVVEFVTYAFFNNPKVAVSDIESLGIARYVRKHESNESDEVLKAQVKESQKYVRMNCLVRMATTERMRLLKVYK
jgi:hypothetical protein